MASLLHADLPSEDEEDDNYDPTTDKTAEPEDRVVRSKRKTDGPARRGLVASTAPAPAANVKIVTALDTKRKAKAAALFEQLKAKSNAVHSRPSSQPPARAPTPVPTTATGAPSAASRKRKAADPDLLWKRSLGLAPPAKLQRTTEDLVAAVLSASTTRPLVALRPPPPAAAPAGSLPQPAAQPAAPVVPEASSQEPPEPTPPVQAAEQEDPAVGAAAAAALDYAALAAQALANAEASMAADAARRAGTVRVMEKRRFAGSEIEIAREFTAGSKEAEAAAAKAAVGDTGLDAVLHQITGPKKANVMDKTRDDWSGFKDNNKDVHQELEQYKKSGDKYLDKQAFLKRAELTEYEKERDARLGADMRSRGRL